MSCPFAPSASLRQSRQPSTARIWIQKKNGKSTPNHLAVMLISHKLVEGSKGSSTVAVVEFAEQSLPHNIIRQPSEVARSFRLLSAVSLSRSHRPQLIRSSWPRLLLETRCMTLVPMPSFLPTLRMPSPLPSTLNIRASTEGLTSLRQLCSSAKAAKTEAAPVCRADHQACGSGSITWDC
jgi:hypothetical protein